MHVDSILQDESLVAGALGVSWVLQPDDVHSAGRFGYGGLDV